MALLPVSIGRPAQLVVALQLKRRPRRQRAECRLALKFIERLAVTLVINTAASENLFQGRPLDFIVVRYGNNNSSGADKHYVLGISSANEAELPFKDLAMFLTARERQIRQGHGT